MNEYKEFIKSYLSILNNTNDLIYARKNHNGVYDNLMSDITSSMIYYKLENIDIDNVIFIELLSTKNEYTKNIDNIKLFLDNNIIKVLSNENKVSNIKDIFYSKILNIFDDNNIIIDLYISQKYFGFYISLEYSKDDIVKSISTYTDDLKKIEDASNYISKMYNLKFKGFSSKPGGIELLFI